MYYRKMVIILFQSSYLLERGCIVVSQFFNKSGNRLNVVENGELQHRLTAIEPNIEEILRKHLFHPH